MNCAALRKCTPHVGPRAPGPGPQPRSRLPLQPALTRADQGHGAVAALPVASQRAPGLALQPPRATSGPPRLPGRSDAGRQLPGVAMLAQLLHVGRWPVARLSLQQLTETALSQHAIEQEKARLGTLGCFRIGSAPSGELSKGLEAGRPAETTFPMRLREP